MSSSSSVTGDRSPGAHPRLPTTLRDIISTPDVFSTIASFLRPTDIGRFDITHPVICRQSRANELVHEQQLAAWLKTPRLPKWMFFFSPIDALRSLILRSPRGLPADAYLSVLLQRGGNATIPSQWHQLYVAESCSRLSNDSMRSGEPTVRRLVEALITQHPVLTEEHQSQLRACVRNGTAESPFRTLGDLPAQQAHCVLLPAGHTGSVVNAIALADGRLVTTSGDETARVWTKQPDGTWHSTVLRGHNETVFGATVLPDGRLVTTSFDHTVGIWTQQPEGTWQSRGLGGHEDFVTGATVLVGGRLVTTSYDGTARLWTEQQDGTWQSRVIYRHSRRLIATTGLPDGRLVTTSQDGTVQVLREMPEGRWHRTVLVGHTSEVMSATVLADGRLVTTSYDGTARVWTEQLDGTWLAVVLAGHTDAVRGAAVLADGSLATTSVDGTVRVWTAQPDGTWQSRLLGQHQNWALGATVFPDGRLVTTSNDGSVRIWSVPGSV